MPGAGAKQQPPRSSLQLARANTFNTTAKPKIFFFFEEKNEGRRVETTSLSGTGRSSWSRLSNRSVGRDRCMPASGCQLDSRVEVESRPIVRPSPDSHPGLPSGQRDALELAGSMRSPPPATIGGVPSRRRSASAMPCHPNSALPVPVAVAAPLGAAPTDPAHSYVRKGIFGSLAPPPVASRCTHTR